MGVSVIMPSFNQAQFLERAVRSVLANQHDRVSELIVMDGGSNDGTVALLQRLEAEFGAPRLRWRSELDRGPANALNKALAWTRQPLIGWLNSDDLYLPGAVQRAVEFFESHPDHWMVYGQAEHVDADDRSLGTYPTRSPAAGLQGFADGCYICQPTVFLRRVALRMVGGFDESQRTAFDLALWLRFAGPHQGRIGFIDALQACSRLHDACITITQRSQVIRESMTLVARHLGSAPLHWVQTYADEVLAAHPDGAVELPRTHLQAFAEEVGPLMSAVDRATLRQVFESDARLRMAEPGAKLDVYPDGWLPTTSALRWKPGAARAIEIEGRHVESAERELELTLGAGKNATQVHVVSKHGPFRLRFELPEHASCDGKLELRCRGGFIPALRESGSGDNRSLACRIDRLRLIH